MELGNIDIFKDKSEPLVIAGPCSAEQRLLQPVV